MSKKVRYPSLEGLLSEVDLYSKPCSNDRPPRIGISANRKDGLSCLAETYVQAVADAGGAPVIIPAITDLSLLTSIVEGIDGLVMSGGADINPLFVNEDPIPQLQDVDTYRDEFDLMLIRLATNRQIPIMGICRGHQLMNIAFGGTIYQDIYSQATGSPIKHSQKQAREYPSHAVSLTSGKNPIRDILGGANEIMVNSFHHQAVKDIAPGFMELAKASDGIDEAIGHPEKPIFSIQWHPEAMEEIDEKAKALFRYHVENATLFAKAKAIHQSSVILDSHTDTPMIFPGEFNIGRKEGGKVNLPFMEEGLTDVDEAVRMQEEALDTSRKRVEALKTKESRQDLLRTCLRTGDLYMCLESPEKDWWGMALRLYREAAGAALLNQEENGMQADYDDVAAAASRLAGHPYVPVDERKQHMYLVKTVAGIAAKKCPDPKYSDWISFCEKELKELEEEGQ